MKNALADQQSAISTLMKKELELNSSNGKLVYGGHEDKFGGNGSAGLIGNGTVPRSTGQSYAAYANGLSNGGGGGGELNNSIVHSKNSLNATSRAENVSSLASLGVAAAAAAALRNGGTSGGNGTSAAVPSGAKEVASIEDEEQRNDVPALKNQFQVGIFNFFLLFIMMLVRKLKD